SSAYFSKTWLGNHPGRSSTSLQNTTLRLNCSSRISIPGRVLVVVPKRPLPGIGMPAALSALLVRLVFGSPKLGWQVLRKAARDRPDRTELPPPDQHAGQTLAREPAALAKWQAVERRGDKALPRVEDRQAPFAAHTKAALSL